MRNPPPRRDEPAALVYVHGVVRAVSAPRLGRSPGMPGATGGPRIVPVAVGHWMVVSDVPDALYGDVPLRRQVADLAWLGRCAAVHRDALGRAMRGGPVVPLRLFTIFATEARAVSHVHETLPLLTTMLDRLDGRVEYGVRLSHAPTMSPAARSGREVSPRTSATLPPGPGILADAPLRAQVLALIGTRAIEVRERPLPTGEARVWLDLAVLVPAVEGPAFVRAVRTADRDLRAGGHELALTGPWPPFTFATDGELPDLPARSL